MVGDDSSSSTVPPQDIEIALWFAEEVSPHEAALRSYLRSQFPALVDIDDLVQETYARVVHARSSGKVAEARPYMFSTARNAAIDLCRRSRIVMMRPVNEMDALTVLDESPDAAEALSRNQELALLREAIAALPERCRRVIILRKLHGLTHRAIASKLGISENTVSAQITLGVFHIRGYLKSRGVSRERLMEAQPHDRL